MRRKYRITLASSMSCMNLQQYFVIMIKGRGYLWLFFSFILFFIIIKTAGEYANLPLIPAYLNPGVHDYACGVNFASAGAGALSVTNQGFVSDRFCENL